MDREDGVLTQPMKDSLVENRVFLVTNLSSIPDIMDELVAKKVFPDTEDVLCSEKRKEQVRNLLDRLLKRPVADYWKFIVCLFQDRIGQGNIADKILSVYLEKRGTLPPEITRLHQDYLDSQISQQPAGRHVSPMEPDGDFRLPPPQPGVQAASSDPHRSERGHVVSIDSESLAQQQQQRTAQLNAAQQHLAQQRAAQLNAAQQRAAQQHEAQLHAAQQHLAQQRAAQLNAAQQRAAQQHEAQLHAAQQHLAQQRAAQLNAPQQCTGQQRAAQLNAAQQWQGREMMETDSGDGGQLSASLQGAGVGAAAGPSDQSKYYRKKREKPLGVYEMESNPRGLALIIDNEHFESLQHRAGTTQDRRSLERMLTDVLGFEVIVRTDITGKEMHRALSDFSQHPRLQEVDSCFVVFMSHGAKGGVIFGTDGRVDNHCPVRDTYISTTQIQHYFGAINCPCMSGKPKLFIIQACRGTTEDTTRGLIPLGRDIAVENSPDCRTEAAHLDMAWINSTVEEMVAYRQTLIPTVAEVFTEYAATKSVQDMMTQIHARMRNMEIEGGLFVAPGTEPNLSKQWYLNPPSSSC